MSPYWPPLLLLALGLLLSASAFETTSILSAIYNCPYNCSGNGVCNNSTSTCACSAGWAGDGCQYTNTQVVSGQTLTNINVTRGVWTYYTIDVADGNLLVLRINVPTNFSADAIARWGDFPTLDWYDYGFLGSVNGSSIDLRILNPPQGLWHVGLLATSSQFVDLTITASTMCPNGCNGNGVCDTTTGICDCYPQFQLEDCSLEVTPMMDSTPYQGTSSPAAFVYYLLNVPNNVNTITITFALKVPSMNSSVVASPEGHYWTTSIYTLFVAQGYYPDLSRYDYVARVPYGAPSSTYDLTIQNPIPGPTYIGIYGNMLFNFNLYAAYYNLCPNQCTQNGVCMPSSGNCKCDPGWINEDCSTYIRSVHLGDRTPDSMRSYEWKYYNFTIPVAEQDMAIIFKPVDESINLPPLRLYLANGYLPNLEAYDRTAVCPTTVNSTCSITVSRAVPATYYVGVYLNETVEGSLQYHISFKASELCPNHCGGNGHCKAGACVCNAYFSGEDCSLYVRQLSGSYPVPYHGNVVQGVWGFYQLNVTTENHLLFRLNRTGPHDAQGNLVPGAVALYLGVNQLPTIFEYYKTSLSRQSAQQIALTGSDVFPGTYYLGVLGLSNSSSFVIQADASRQCPRNCSGNGVCSNGGCICEPPYIPSDCSSQELPMPSNLELKGRVSFDVWNYYTVTVLGDDALEVLVQETNNRVAGMAWVFLRKNGRPSIETNDYRNQSATLLHTIFVPSTKARGNWTIGITGSPRSSGSNQFASAEYNILSLTGCGTYASCDKCVLDPNCGWCRNQGLGDLAVGQCVPGTPTQPLNQTCLYYQYNDCDVNNRNIATTKGLVIGVVIGVVFALGLGIAAFFVWKEYRRREQISMAPIKFQTHHSAPSRSRRVSTNNNQSTGSLPSISAEAFIQPEAGSSQQDESNNNSGDYDSSNNINSGSSGSLPSISSSVDQGRLSTSYGSIRRPPDGEGYSSLGGNNNVYTDEEESWSSDSEDDSPTGILVGTQGSKFNLK